MQRLSALGNVICVNKTYTIVSETIVCTYISFTYYVSSADNRTISYGLMKYFLLRIKKYCCISSPGSGGVLTITHVVLHRCTTPLCPESHRVLMCMRN